MRTVLITGGSSGIGLGLVKRYLKEYYKVINIDINTPEEKITGDYHFVYADLRKLETLDRVFEEAKSHTKKIDIFIHSAIAPKEPKFSQLSYDTYHEVLNVNLTSGIFLIKHYVSQFYGEHGRIILISSTRAFMSEEETTLYTLSKGAIQGLTHSLAMTFSRHKITVNAIAPGWINTKSEKLREIDHQFHPSLRVGEVEDIVKAALFISDTQNDFFNAQTLVIDGGVTKKMIYPE